eukprot:8176753-Pyramimonas_sp.AAC.1
MGAGDGGGGKDKEGETEGGGREAGGAEREKREWGTAKPQVPGRPRAPRAIVSARILAAPTLSPRQTRLDS